MLLADDTSGALGAVINEPRHDGRCVISHLSAEIPGAALDISPPLHLSADKNSKDE